MEKVTMYTDGACSGNPGAGGYACVLLYKGNKKILSGGEKNTTNNRMELKAVTTGLKALKRKCDVTVYSDSKYVVDAVSKGWAEGWRAKGWKKSDGSPAMNPDLWDELLDLLSLHVVSFIWVKGHDGNEYNEICDKTAVAECAKYK